MTLAFEPERINVVNSVARARMLLDEIGSPWLKVVLDPANLMRADDGPRLAEILDEAVEWLGPDIVLVPTPRILRTFASREELIAIREYLEPERSWLDPGYRSRFSAGWLPISREEMNDAAYTSPTPSRRRLSPWTISIGSSMGR